MSDLTKDNYISLNETRLDTIDEDVLKEEYSNANLNKGWAYPTVEEMKEKLLTHYAKAYAGRGVGDGGSRKRKRRKKSKKRRKKSKKRRKKTKKRRKSRKKK